MSLTSSVRRVRTTVFVFAACYAVTSSLQAEAPQGGQPTDLLIKNATVMTVTQGTIEHGSLWIDRKSVV